MTSKILTFVKETFSLSKCVVCGNIIVGAYYADEMGNKVCMHHKDKAVICLSCGCLCIKEKATIIGHNQFVCESCTSCSPQDKDVQKITSYVRKVLFDSGIEGIPSFNLNRVELDVLYEAMGKPCLGLAKYNGVHCDIYVLKYLSRTCFASVLAHEMLHLWQYKNGFSLRQDICEGICNLGSYVVLKSIGTKVAQTRMAIIEKDIDHIYGDGFRKVKSVYDCGGWAMVIKKIKETGKTVIIKYQ